MLTRKPRRSKTRREPLPIDRHCKQSLTFTLWSEDKVSAPEGERHKPRSPRPVYLPCGDTDLCHHKSGSIRSGGCLTPAGLSGLG